MNLLLKIEVNQSRTTKPSVPAFGGSAAAAVPPRRPGDTQATTRDAKSGSVNRFMALGYCSLRVHAKRRKEAYQRRPLPTLWLRQRLMRRGMCRNHLVHVPKAS